MVLPRTSAFGSIFRSSAARTARLRSTSQTWRTAGRRFYASDHGHGKKSSDLPWLIGSVAVTVPSAAWLLQQRPTKGDHGHGHDDHGDHKAHEKVEEEHKKEGGEEGRVEGSDESKDGGDGDAKADGGDKDSSDDSEKEGDDNRDESKPTNQTPDTPETSDDETISEGQVTKGQGEKQKGLTRPRTEKKGEKDAAKDVSGAANPYLASPEKSKKGEGITDSAKIHGTVDSGRNVRGSGDEEKPKKLEERPEEKPSPVPSER